MASNNAYGEVIRPFRKWFAITPDDANDLSEVPRALYVGGAGDIVLKDGTGTDITVTVGADEIIHFSPVRILATGTTATGIVGLV